ncbi:hypothetical protein U9M48_004689 [Paspalum notatum var. saurae]|uniref:DUF1618 domain-containing protein n=1 Tax=Paspalum notatum var. saurae TaxID=547442 RepID=A0AAQ3PNH4_PASNO
MRASSTNRDTDASGGHRCPKRSNGRSSSSSMGSSDSHPSSWVILNKHGARRDSFPGDRTTSTTFRSSDGKEISVSFELVEPPGTSVLVVECPPQEPGPPASALWHSCQPCVIAAHRDVVLLEITCPQLDSPYSCRFVDYLVYQASGGGGSSRRPSLSLLPDHCKRETASCSEATPRPSPVRIFVREKHTGIMSCGGRNQEQDSSFVVAQLHVAHDRKIWPPSSKPSEITVSMFRSWSGEWEIFKNLHVHGSNGGRDLEWWSTDAVVAYRRRFFIWVDYYRGMILLDMSSQLSQEKSPPPPRPELRYVPLPVDTVPGDPEDPYFGRGSPRMFRSVCATRDGVKFVSVDHQRCSSFGVGHAGRLRWKQTFRITTWSLQEDDDGGDYTWRKEATMSEGELWDALNSERRRRRIPHLTPEYPAVYMENPDAVCFRLRNDDRYKSDEPTWMVEVHMKKKVLMAATAYSESKDGSSCGCYVDKGTIESARISSEGHLSFPSELPRYLVGGQACKKRTQL